jgi:hypothetical protein
MDYKENTGCDDMSNALTIHEKVSQANVCVCVVISLFVVQKTYFGSRKLCFTAKIKAEFGEH